MLHWLLCPNPLKHPLHWQRDITPLHLAAKFGHNHVVEVLLRAPGIFVGSKRQGELAKWRPSPSHVPAC